MQFVFLFFLTVLFFSISEVAILLWVSIHTGLLFTILACALTGIVGGTLVHRQGILTLRNINDSLSQGKLPADELIGGLLLLIVGVLLCVPGFITDTLGFLIVIPGIRHLVASGIRKKLTSHIKSGKGPAFSFSFGGMNTNHQTMRESSSEDGIEDAQIVEVIPEKNSDHK